MIYILSGVAKSGKSLVAKEIVIRKQIPSFSTDYIMMMLSRGNKDLGIDIDGFDRDVATHIEPYVEGMIRTMIENGVTYIIEGVHFNPEFVVRLLKEFPNDIKALFLGFKDLDPIVKGKELHTYQDTSGNKWFLDLNTKDFNIMIEHLISESKITFDLCNEYGLNYIEIHDISMQIDEIIHTLFT